MTTMPVNPDMAERVHGLATALLHCSPEPQVLEPLIQSGALLGRDDSLGPTICSVSAQPTPRTTLAGQK